MTIVAVSLTAGFLALLPRLLAEQFLVTPVPLLGEFFSLSLVENRGVAFGIALPFLFQEILIGAAVAVVAVLAWRSRRSMPHALGFGLILGGAFANILDRLDDGLVTDFIRVGSFPTFNVADSCITVGVGFLLLVEWRQCCSRRNDQ